MEKQIEYSIQFFSHWHTGSGLSGGAYADAIVIKNSDGFPFIPGKTIKGLLHHAALEINRFNSAKVDSTFTKHFFGREGYESQSFQTFFSDATLSQSLANQLKELGEASRNVLYETISATQIDEGGQAAVGSLRQMEITVPITLFGSIYTNESFDLSKLKACLSFIKCLGLNRNRGLGRCDFKLITQKGL